MRRGIGVAHIQQQRQTQQQMAQLGAQITAERVGQIANQLEMLEQQLRSLAEKHKDEIKNDPLVRARFRQLADSLGVDLISSQKNVFAGALGLGDFYYNLAGKVVEVCMKEGKFCGSYVPLARVVRELQRQYDAQAAAAASAAEDAGKKKPKPITIDEDDVTAALKKLDCLGAGYNVVTLARVKYIQTTPDGALGGDEVPLLNYVLGEQKRRIDDAQQAAQASLAPTISTGVRDRAAAASPAASRAHAQSSGGPLLGAAYVLGAHPLSLSEGVVSLGEQCVSLRQRELAAGLGWPAHRVYAVMQRMVQDGAVWVDYPTAVTGARGAAPTPHSGGSRHGIRSSPAKAAHARRGGHETIADGDDEAVYWFISLTTSAGETV